MTDSGKNKWVVLKKCEPLLAKMKSCGSAFTENLARVGQKGEQLFNAIKPYWPTLVLVPLLCGMIKLGPVWGIVAVLPAIYLMQKQDDLPLSPLGDSLTFVADIVLSGAVVLSGTLMSSAAIERNIREENAAYEQAAHIMVADGKTQANVTTTVEHRNLTSWTYEDQELSFGAKILGIKKRTEINSTATLYDVEYSTQKEGKDPEAHRTKILILTPKKVEAQPL